ncbi:MAG: aminotransferase class I/II-fold pyridoxal phosphate-dependent enzyme [Clostridia bacterium]|nr:aminotransferase class I/II-fold pyridoxal phosphate-dependent enzyme [Clostridia bacterium]
MRSSYVAKRFAACKPSLSLDTEALKKYTDIIDLSIGDTDFITDERIISAAFADAKAGYTRYGDPKGDPQLIEAIRTAWAEDFGQTVPAEEVLVTASSCLGMSLAMMALLDPGDEVIVFGPYFAIYRQQIEMAGGVCVEVPTYAEDGYDIRQELLEKAITDKTKAVIINNPCNPTGAAYDRPCLEMLAKVAQEKDLLVIADEIYTRYLYDGESIPMRTLPGMEQRTVTLNSFSKNFMMTGWRVGFVIAPAEIIGAISHINGAMIYTTPAMSQRAAIKALALRNEMEEKYIRHFRERVMYAHDRLSKMDYISIIPPRGTFYLFPGIEKTGLTAGEFCQVLLEKAHILVSPGDAFGAAGKQHFRIACTTDMDKLKEAMDRMEGLTF